MAYKSNKKPKNGKNVLNERKNDDKKRLTRTTRTPEEKRVDKNFKKKGVGVGIGTGLAAIGIVGAATLYSNKQQVQHKETEKSNSSSGVEFVDEDSNKHDKKPIKAKSNSKKEQESKNAASLLNDNGKAKDIEKDVSDDKKLLNNVAKLLGEDSSSTDEKNAASLLGNSTEYNDNSSIDNIKEQANRSHKMLEDLSKLDNNNSNSYKTQKLGTQLADAMNDKVISKDASDFLNPNYQTSNSNQSKDNTYKASNISPLPPVTNITTSDNGETVEKPSHIENNSNTNDVISDNNPNINETNSSNTSAGIINSGTINDSGSEHKPIDIPPYSQSKPSQEKPNSSQGSQNSSVSTSTSQSMDNSLSASVSASVSASLSASISASVSQSVSASISQSLSQSISASISQSLSNSLSGTQSNANVSNNKDATLTNKDNNVTVSDASKQNESVSISQQTMLNNSKKNSETSSTTSEQKSQEDSSSSLVAGNSNIKDDLNVQNKEEKVSVLNSETNNDNKLVTNQK